MAEFLSSKEEVLIIQKGFFNDQKRIFLVTQKGGVLKNS
jgi:hypothetical protein